ncbi:hypothetical protein [Cohnella yongneupensis]|uniref:Uncharacterized protein n=1 Tax=Cohnella yongneupensis TaxID=425006 RepID=A0ABW0R3R2_9BACL
MNAEGDKIQYAIGVPDGPGDQPKHHHKHHCKKHRHRCKRHGKIGKVLKVNKSVRKTIESVASKERILLEKLKTIMDYLDPIGPTGATRA